MTKPLLVIGNKRYSSWSLRGWIGLASTGVDFDEERIPLDTPTTRERILRHSEAGLVPILKHEGVTVHESLAVLEYVNETWAQGALWPKEAGRRAMARAISTEMHGGFPALRRQLPMNLGRPPGPLPANRPLEPATQKDVARVLRIWERLLQQNAPRGPWLFGDWSIADCMYLPVATRFHTYAINLNATPHSRAYVQRMMAAPAFQPWLSAAQAETERIASEEV